MMGEFDVDMFLQKRNQSDLMFGKLFDNDVQPTVSRSRAEEDVKALEWINQHPYKPEPIVPGRVIRGTFIVLSKTPIKPIRTGYMFKIELEANGNVYPMVYFGTDANATVQIYNAISISGKIGVRGIGNRFYGRPEIIVKGRIGHIWTVS